MIFIKRDANGVESLRSWLVFTVFILFFVSLFTIQHFVSKNHDANTHIENAQVISTEKSKGARRSLPNYYVIVQEQGKTETTRVTVNIGTWVGCKPGKLLKDLPGEQPKCYDLGRIGGFTADELGDIKPYVPKLIEIPSYPPITE